MRAPGWIVTVPAQSFSAPARACVTAAARCMPGVCGVLVSSASPGITRTPSVRQSRVMAPTLARRQPFAGGRVGREERLDGQLGQRDVMRTAEGRQRRVEREIAVRVGEGDGEQQLLRGGVRVGSRARRRRPGSRGPPAAGRRGGGRRSSAAPVPGGGRGGRSTPRAPARAAGGHRGAARCGRRWARSAAPGRRRATAARPRGWSSARRPSGRARAPGRARGPRAGGRAPPGPSGGARRRGRTRRRPGRSPPARTSALRSRSGISRCSARCSSSSRLARARPVSTKLRCRADTPLTEARSSWLRRATWRQCRSRSPTVGAVLMTAR